MSLAEADEEIANGKEEARKQGYIIIQLQEALAKEKGKVKRIWREKCDQHLAHKEAIDSKDLEIVSLKTRLLSQTISPLPKAPSSHDSSIIISTPVQSHHRGKAPPVDAFSAENEDERWDDWLP